MFHCGESTKIFDSIAVLPNWKNHCIVIGQRECSHVGSNTCISYLDLDFPFIKSFFFVSLRCGCHLPVGGVRKTKLGGVLRRGWPPLIFKTVFPNNLITRHHVTVLVTQQTLLENRCFEIVDSFPRKWILSCHRRGIFLIAIVVGSKFILF